MMDTMDSIKEKAQRCAELLDYKFRNPALLETALTHSSSATTHKDSNERMEFLGDSVLGLTISHLLYEKFPEETEGDLTNMKSALVSRKTCYRIARAKGFDACIQFAGGIVTPPDSMIANLLESIIGAIYLDAGFVVAARFIVEWFQDELKALIRDDEVNNYKASLQQYQQRFMPHKSLTYCLLDEQGPSHRRCFKVGVSIDNYMYQPAWGTTKKEAEQRAAQNAMCILEGLPAPHPDGD